MVFKGLWKNAGKMCTAHQPSTAQRFLQLICAFNRQKKSPLENKILYQLSYTPRSYLNHEYSETHTVNLHSLFSFYFISVVLYCKGCEQG